MKETVRVSGLRELDRALGQLPKATGKSILRRVAVQALEPMAATARALAPDDPTTANPHDLGDSIIISSRQKSGRQVRRTREGAATVTAYMGPSRDGYPQAIPQEFGSAPHTIKAKPGNKSGLFIKDAAGTARPAQVQHPGNPPHPFMRPAWEQHKAEALQIIRNGLGAAIQKAAQRIARRAARVAKG